MLYRTFIALEVPDRPRACLAEKLRWLRGTPGVKWVREDNLHLTLLFLGDVDSARIPDLARVMTEAAGRSAPFELALKGLELFPWKSPRLIWASLEALDDSLYRWHKHLLSEIRTEGFKPDAKPLKLHITLGRIKSALPPTLEREILQSEVERGSFTYDRITLYRSVLKPEGPTYHSLEQCILR